MCALSGCAGTLMRKEEIFAQHELIHGTVRGYDSTGMGFIYRENKKPMRVMKKLGPAFELLDHKSFEQCFKGQLKALIGHNRSATKGDICEENAHPFMFQDVVGTHNGTLRFGSEDKLKKDIKDGDKYETDSEAIIAHLQVFPDPKDTVDKIEGAYALVWYDKRTNSINMIRNEERPLFYAFDEDRKVLFWASLAEMILLGAVSNLIKLEKDTKIHCLPVDTYLQWKIPPSNDKFNKEPDQRLHIEGFKYSYSATNYGSNKFTGTDESAWAADANYYATGNYAMGAPKSTSVTPLGGSREQLWNPVTKKLEYPDGWVNGKVVVRPGWKKLEHNGKVTYEYVGVDQNHPWEAEGAKIIQMKPKPSVIPPTQEELQAWFDVHEEYKHLPVVYTSSGIRVFWDTDHKTYKVATFKQDKKAWDVTTSKSCPHVVPLTKVNWESGGNHQFAYKQIHNISTKQKERAVYYKGFKGNLLGSSTFDKAMANGCFGCQRTDGKWGIEVVFINANNDFLCEHCARDKTLVNELCKVA